MAVPTVSLHARKLGLEKRYNRWLFTDAECAKLDGSIVGAPGRPKKPTQL